MNQPESTRAKLVIEEEDEEEEEEDKMDISNEEEVFVVSALTFDSRYQNQLNHICIG